MWINNSACTTCCEIAFILLIRVPVCRSRSRNEWNQVKEGEICTRKRWIISNSLLGRGSLSTNNLYWLRSIDFMSIENFEMLQALYNFDAVYAKTIRWGRWQCSVFLIFNIFSPHQRQFPHSFREDEFFVLHQTSSRQRNWLQVVNEHGNIGFVPSNYVQKLTVSAMRTITALEFLVISPLTRTWVKNR